MILELLVSIILSILLYFIFFGIFISIIMSGANSSKREMSSKDKVFFSIAALVIIFILSVIYMLSGGLFVGIMFGLPVILYIIFMKIIHKDLTKNT